MIRIIMNGYQGRMGRVITELAGIDGNCEIVAGVDVLQGTSPAPFPTYTHIGECDMDADVIIDFSVPSAVNDILDFATERQMATVICTTGLTAENLNKITESSKKAAIFKSANMSLGINLLANLLKRYSKILYDESFDIEIIEKHHNQKIDAPSGTALLLADVINSRLDNSLEQVFDRSAIREKRRKNELGIHAMRGGTIVGEHSVIFAGKDEVVEFSHAAYSKEVFAVGALKAAKYIAGKSPGLYSMEHIMDEL